MLRRYQCQLYRNVYLTLKVREWTCPQYGMHHDRNLNAAFDIRQFCTCRRGMLPGACGLAPDGERMIDREAPCESR